MTSTSAQADSPVGAVHLVPQVARLRAGTLDLHAEIDVALDRIARYDGQVRAFVPEPDRRARLHAEADVLAARFPEPDSRPPLYGVLLGIKDVFAVDGLPTRAGSALPAEEFAMPQGAAVTRLRNAGALVLGKTITAEFAGADPGATTNPHDATHTPGGSSSGSAAAVASGYVPLALGTQTVGSMIRPAAFCGIVGFKPSFGRVPTTGLLPFSPSVDHVGWFTQDVAGARLAATVLMDSWSEARTPDRAPTLGVPVGPYLAQAAPEALAAFEATVGSSRVDLQACKLEYSIVSPK